MGARKAKEIRVRIDRHLDLWKRRIHAGLVGYALEEGRVRDGRVARSDKDEEDRLACRLHSTLLPGKLWQVVCQDTDREGEGGVFYQGMPAQRTGDQLQISSGRNTPTCVYPP